MTRRTRLCLLAAIPTVMLLVLWLWKPWVLPGIYASTEELGYVIEYEIDPKTEHMTGNNPDRDGKEYVGVVVQGHYSLMILDGQLTVNRVPRGEVRKGDRIMVSKDQRVWVNGKKRE